jgi:hypothetical protein
LRLYRSPIAPAVSRKRRTPASSLPLQKRGRGHDLAARRVFLVHRERPGVDPLHRVGALAVRLERALELRRTALHLEHAGKDPFRREAALDAGLHHGPDAREFRFHPGRRTERLLVAEHQARDREAGALRLREQLLAAAERQRHADGGRGVGRGRLVLPLHGPAADRVHLLRQQRLSAGIARGEAHAVRMARQHLVAVEKEVHRFVKRYLALAGDAQPSGSADARERRLHHRGVELRRVVTLEAEQDGPVGAVAEPRQRERAVELDVDLGRPVEQALRLQVLDEESRSQHRPHRVRRGRPDAHLEYLEGREVHRAASRRRIWSAISPASATRSVSSSCSLASTADSS